MLLLLCEGYNTVFSNYVISDSTIYCINTNNLSSGVCYPAKFSGFKIRLKELQ